MTSRIIAIEGPDGVGKATTAGIISRHLRQDAVEVAEISFPRYDVGHIGSQIRNSLQEPKSFSDSPIWERGLLFALDRKGYVNSLKDESFVVADRWTASNAAYLRAQTQCDSAVDWVEDLEFAKLDLPRPVVTVLVIADEDLQSARLVQRAKSDDVRELDQFERRPDLQRNVRDAYKFLAAREFGGIWRQIDNAGSLHDLEDRVANIYRDVLRPLLNL